MTTRAMPTSTPQDGEATLKQVVFQRVGRPPLNLTEPDWARMVVEMKRKSVTLLLHWKEYRAAYPDGYGYTWLCEL